MFRRNFIQQLTYSLAASGGTKTVTYRVEGFTCVTCAVGLDTMLKSQKGIVQSKSSYPDRTSVIEYKPDLVTEDQIKTYIEEIGFKAK